MLDIFSTADAWISLATLAALEIVLGIDNLVFISILADKLPKAKQSAARRIGLALALISRLGLLFAISWVMGLQEELFRVFEHSISGRDLILLGGGVFLIGKATHEIYEKMELKPHEALHAHGAQKLGLVLLQIMVLDIVFSLDSVITAVGMAKHLIIMVIAMVMAVGVMLLFANKVGDFVNNHPSMKILALSFLLLVGVLLTAEGFGQHVNKGYIYFAMAFSLLVELVNMRVRKARRAPVALHGGFVVAGDDTPASVS